MIRTACTMFLSISLLLVAGALAGEAAGGGAPAPAPAAVPVAEGGRPQGVPGDAEAWLVLPRPARTLDSVKNLVDIVATGKGAVARITLLGLLTKYCGKTVDQSRPVVCVFRLEKKPKFALGASLLAGAEPKKYLEMTFGKAQKTEGGISTFLEVQDGALPDKKIFVSVSKGRLIAGDDRKLVSSLAALPAPAAADYAKKDSDFLAGMDLKSVTARHKQTVDGFLKQLKDGGMPGVMMPPGAGSNLTGSVLAGMARSTMKNVDVLTVDASISDKEVSLGYGLRAVKGGEFAKSLETLAKAKLPAVSRPDGRALATVAADFGPEFNKQTLGFLKPLVLAAFAGDENAEARKDLESYFAAAVEACKTFDGKFSENVIRRGGGLCIMIEARPGEKGRVAVNRAVKAGLSKSLRAKWAEAGFKMEFTEKFRTSGKVDVDRMTADVKTVPNPKLPPEMQGRIQEMQRRMMEATYGLPIVYELAYPGKRMVMVMGKEAAKVMDEQIKRLEAGKAAGPAMAATLKRAPGGSFMVGEVDLIEYAYVIVDMMGRMMPAGMMPDVDLGAEPAKPATFWVAARDGELRIRYNVPLAPLKRMVDGVKGAQQQMMDQLRGPQPVPLPDGGGAEQF